MSVSTLPGSRARSWAARRGRRRRDDDDFETGGGGDLRQRRDVLPDGCGRRPGESSAPECAARRPPPWSGRSGPSAPDWRRAGRPRWRCRPGRGPEPAPAAADIHVPDLRNWPIWPWAGPTAGPEVLRTDRAVRHHRPPDRQAGLRDGVGLARLADSPSRRDASTMGRGRAVAAGPFTMATKQTWEWGGGVSSARRTLQTR